MMRCVLFPCASHAQREQTAGVHWALNKRPVALALFNLDAKMCQYLCDGVLVRTVRIIHGIRRY